MEVSPHPVGMLPPIEYGPETRPQLIIDSNSENGPDTKPVIINGETELDNNNGQPEETPDNDNLLALNQKKVEPKADTPADKAGITDREDWSRYNQAMAVSELNEYKMSGLRDWVRDHPEDSK